MNYEEYIVKVYEDGGTSWHNKEGKFHRLNGSAVEHIDGYKAYWINGKLHNLEGPAIIYPNGEVEYCIEDIFYTKESWKKEVQRIKFFIKFSTKSLENQEVVINGIKYKLVPADCEEK